MKLESLEDLFLEELKDLYDAEKQLTKALPKMAKAAASEELAAAFEEHLEVTQGQVNRLEQIFESMGESPGRKKCEGMKGLVEEGKEVIQKKADDSVKDAALIAAAQKVEHYEMAGYGCVRTWAQLLGNNEAAELLQESLDEEGEADKKLTEIAQSLNVEAQGDGESAESEEEDEEEDEDEEEAEAAATSRRTRR
jgi:ferritin-like metal-binding protein YciE